MIPNNSMFRGKEVIEVDGRYFYRSYKIERLGKYRMHIHVISVNSVAEQGIAFTLSEDPKFKGDIIINEKPFNPYQYNNQFYIIPVNTCDNKDIVFDVDATRGYLRLANASNYLDTLPELSKRISELTGRKRNQFRGCSFASGFTAAFLYGNAFWIEILSENLIRFHCNDHELDDDFDDLTFDVTFE